MKVSHSKRVQDQRELWRVSNRKALREIANQFGISYTFVRLVFKGLHRSGELRVERELARRGCPGFEEETIAA
jgi:predicted DNA-binding transcriptional regulator